MFTRTRTQKAKKEGRKAVKRAEKTSKKAAKRAEKAAKDAQERAADYAERAGEAAAEAASEVAERLRKSEGLAKAQAKGREYAGKAKQRWDDSDMEDRLVDAAHRVRDSDAAKKAGEKTRDVTDASLAALGEWLTTSKTGKQVGDKLGVQKRRRWRMVLATGIGVGAGYMIARLVQTDRLPEYDEFTASAERLATEGAATGTELISLIRSALSDDPKTAELDELRINVAEGTVFVRGTVPEGTDENAIRTVVSAVPGVSDVDLQLSHGASQP
jgi:hypothetical protein